MNYSDMFAMLGASNDPYDGQFDGPQQPCSTFPASTSCFDTSYQPAPAPMSWEEAFNGFKTRPVLYNMDGWISPYASNNWGGTSNILAYIDEQYKLPMGETRIDPNRIFTAEVNGLRALSADQAKILKMFEKKFAESITEKDKVGLTEEDIEAMSAITAARTALTNIEKEKVAIKKNIADIKIKQAQNTNTPTGGTTPAGMTSSSDIGRDILDNIFAAQGMTMMNPIPTTGVDYPVGGVDEGTRVIDGLFGDGPSNTIAAEKKGIHPVAVLDNAGNVEEILLIDKDNYRVTDPSAGVFCPTIESVENIHLDIGKVDIGQEQSIDIINRDTIREE